MAKADDRLTEQRRALPDSPGVYLFKDASGRVLYVGKAKSIRKRVASHFGAGGTVVGSISMLTIVRRSSYFERVSAEREERSG